MVGFEDGGKVVKELFRNMFPRMDFCIVDNVSTPGVSISIFFGDPWLDSEKTSK